MSLRQFFDRLGILFGKLFHLLAEMFGHLLDVFRGFFDDFSVDCSDSDFMIVLRGNLPGHKKSNNRNRRSRE